MGRKRSIRFLPSALLMRVRTDESKRTKAEDFFARHDFGYLSCSMIRYPINASQKSGQGLSKRGLL